MKAKEKIEVTKSQCNIAAVKYSGHIFHRKEGDKYFIKIANQKNVDEIVTFLGLKK